MSKIQQETGKSFENELLELLFKNGYWATKLKTGINGTAFDILAIKNNRAYAFECKTVKESNVIRYTQELRKKTDELDYYENKNNSVYLVVRFAADIKIMLWQKAKRIFLEKGYLAKDEMRNLEEFI